MASAYATLAASASTTSRTSCRRWSTRGGEVLFDVPSRTAAANSASTKAVADNVTSAMQPIAGMVQRPQPGGGRLSAAKTGTNQLGDTDANRDAWMVGYTPSLSTAVWVGTTEGNKPLVNKWGSPVYGSGLPSTSGSRRWTARGGYRERVVPRADPDRWLRGAPHRHRHAAAGRIATPPLGDGDSAEYRGGARHHDPIGPPTTVPIAPPARRTRAHRQADRRWTSSAAVTERDETASPTASAGARRPRWLEPIAAPPNRQPR